MLEPPDFLETHTSYLRAALLGAALSPLQRHLIEADLGKLEYYPLLPRGSNVDPSRF